MKIIIHHGAAMSNSSAKRLPFVILTGFLGSGKTTFLRKIIETTENSKTAIIVNEVGDIGIDDALIQSVSETTILLKSGCICCSIRQDLVTTLLEMTALVGEGKLQPFDRVILETTGIADPAPIIHTLMTHDEISLGYYLETIVTTLDCELAEQTLRHHEELEKQIALADTIVITKMDLASNKNAKKTINIAKQLNSTAAIICGGDAIDMNELFNCGLINNGRAKPENWLKTADTTHNHSNINNFSLSYETPLKWKDVADSFDLLIQLHGDDLLRVKGVLNIEDVALPVVIQGVQHIFYPPALLEKWHSKPSSRLVFITRNVSMERIKNLMQPLLNPKYN